MYHTVFSEEQK